MRKMTRRERQIAFRTETFVQASFFKMKSVGSPSLDKMIHETMKPYGPMPSPVVQHKAKIVQEKWERRRIDREPFHAGGKLMLDPKVSGYLSGCFLGFVNTIDTDGFKIEMNSGFIYICVRKKQTQKWQSYVQHAKKIESMSSAELDNEIQVTISDLMKQLAEATTDE